MSEAIADLKRELGPKLLRPEQLTPPPGIATGWSGLDRFLLWHGFPKGQLSLLIGEAGGSTSLWVRSAAAVTRQGQWAAWINEPESSLTPWILRRAQADLAKCLVVAPPVDVRQLLWVLQELMSLSLFEIIGCDLGGLELKDHHVLKLRRLALRSQTALVLQTRTVPRRLSSFYALILHFQRRQVVIQRALHRSTPHSLERRELYADTLPQLTAGRSALCG